MTSGSAAVIRLAAIRRLKRVLRVGVASSAALWGGAIAPCMAPFALAETLPKERCAELAAEHSLLEGGGAGANIQRGPDWAKANLTPEQIGYVRRLIEVREDLLFRCRNFELEQDAADPSAPSLAPAMAPLPVRRPAVPEGRAQVVPVPDRPSQVNAKDEKRPAGGVMAGAARDGMHAMSADGAPKPQLRGTLPVAPAAVPDMIPTPQRKAKPAPGPAAGN